jgi:hypothetical protein
LLEVIKETVFDAVKLLPFLFLVFLVMEFIEHRYSGKTKKVILKSGKFGPLLGSILGAFPQCGFSVAMTNLYATRIVSMGTLIAIYLSTTDEMLPILISRGVSVTEIIKLIGIQVIVAIIFGFLIDFVMKKKTKDTSIKDFCEIEHCDCEHKGILKSSIVHALSIFIYIVLVSFVLNVILHYIGEDFLSNLFLKDSIFSPIIASTIGLIPNCVSSVMLTELYLNGIIGLGSVISGLLTASGVSFLVLFRVNKNIKENLTIVGLTYIIGIIAGIVIDLLF